MIHVADPRPTERERMLAEAAGENKEATIYSRNKTPLGRSLDESQQAWLLNYAVSRWGSLHGALLNWRGKMARYEQMADDDYSSRKGAPDREHTSELRTIFDKSNHTLGLVSGFADFAHAQAKDDIFGVRPWLNATPQGASDMELADRITKHSQWKFDQSNIESVYQDGIRLAVDLGTAFVKFRWAREIDVSESIEHVAIDLSTGQPIVKPDGDFIRTEEEAQAMITAAAEAGTALVIDWEERVIENAIPIYDNIEASCLDWKGVAFEPTAPELDLRYTDFLLKAPPMGLHDICAAYELDEEQKQHLLTLAGAREITEARSHREEADGTTMDAYKFDPESNPEIELIEGFLRCDPSNSGRPVRIHVIFSPALNVMFRCDYLANVTPGAMLPVFPLRCFKTPRRITGKGYFQKYEDDNDSIDRLFNSMVHRNRAAAEVFKGIDKTALKDNGEGQDLVNSPEKLYELQPDKKMEDAVSFATVPDANNRSDSLMNQRLQMAQMRSGITSAAQGELKGVPNAETATGVQQMMSRGAVLVKNPIDQLSDDIEKATDFAVHLNYANQDFDETFTWGEGKDAELMEIKANDVRGLRANVSLTMTRAQSFTKLESAKAAIGLAAQYAALPEPEKTAQRRLYVQAIQALGFNDADKIIRQAVLDPAGITALLPPEFQQAFAQFLGSVGMAEAATPPGGDAPVTGQAES